MNKILSVFSIAFFLVSCGGQQDHIHSPKTAGFSVFEPGVSWAIGSDESIEVWKKWCDYHVSEDLDSIMMLASDTISISGANGELIENKEQLKGFLTQWFSESDISFEHMWATSVTNPEGDGGEWVLNGYSFEVSNDTMSNKANHFAGVYVKDGMVHQFSIFEQKLPQE